MVITMWVLHYIKAKTKTNRLLPPAAVNALNAALWSWVPLTPFYSIYCLAPLVPECWFLTFLNVHVLCTVTIKTLLSRCSRSVGETRLGREFFNLPSSWTMVPTRWQWLQCCAIHGVRGFGEVETHRRSTVPPWGGQTLKSSGNKFRMVVLVFRAVRAHSQPLLCVTWYATTLNCHCHLILMT